MEKNGMLKRILAVVSLVIAVIGLNMQGTSVFAETLTPEAQSEMTDDQSESQSEITEAGESVEQTETEETEPSKEQTETVEEQSVSGNDISVEEAEDPSRTIEVLVDAGVDNTITADILNKCIVKGTNPSGVTVNLFDYSQGTAPDGSSEVAHDYYYNWTGGSDNNRVPVVGKDPYVTTYNLGISKNHLLRFGYRGNETHDYCLTTTDNGTRLGDYGAWNEYHAVRWTGIVRNNLYNGYPRLNLDLLQVTDFGRYADDANRSAYLSENNMTESLAYLFSPNVQNQYKICYRAVQGLFQQRTDGYYYYDSQKNFASFNKNTNSFTLYNSSGVAKQAEGITSYGQFFPFNTAYDVFDSYVENNDGSYQLTYQNVKNQGNFNYDPIKIGGNSYIKCYAPNLNHYFGLTLEMRFVQPVRGYVDGSTDESDQMIFSFSGDDDVWIFIDDVLVADLGGIHDALGLTINFATGDVTVAGETQKLRQAFVTAYG
ncbi:MAG: hypothetical protein K2H31_06045, partial [Lachnospiraceae bacterium]|nr:hypothetical protein [Lachnospiraceae bacterium]